MLVVYAVARLSGRFDVCSKALYYAAYLFFYGQNGFMALWREPGRERRAARRRRDAETPRASSAAAARRRVVEARINDTAYVSSCCARRR